jgi:hypothetical protein
MSQSRIEIGQRAQLKSLRMTSVAAAQAGSSSLLVQGQGITRLTHNQFDFLRLKKLGPDGVMRSSIVPVEPHMVKHHLPGADILKEDRVVSVQNGVGHLYAREA